MRVYFQLNYFTLCVCVCMCVCVCVCVCACVCVYGWQAGAGHTIYTNVLVNLTVLWWNEMEYRNVIGGCKNLVSFIGL